VVASWVKRDFAGVGLTQYQPGPRLAAVQERYIGRALLCIDVSGSMSGSPLREAIAGGLDFLTEAEQAHYRCGLILWHHEVAAHLPHTAAGEEVEARLRSARASGGNQLVPSIEVAIGEFGKLTGDRVVCVFGDGDVGDEVATAAEAARARALGIRFVVRGLGSGASECLARALTPGEKDATRTVQDVGDLRGGIASMAQSLRARR
jgi:Mg-chelatase subunit ChlD